MADISERRTLPREVTDAERLQDEINLIERIQSSPSVARMALAVVVVSCSVCESEHLKADVDPYKRGRLPVHGALIGVKDFYRLPSGAIGTRCLNNHVVEPPLTDSTWWMIEKHLGQVEDVRAQHPSNGQSEATPQFIEEQSTVTVKAA